MSAAKVCVAIYELFQPGGTRAKNSTWWDESKCKTSSPGPGQLPRQTKTFQLDQHLSGFLVSGLQSGCCWVKAVGNALFRQILEIAPAGVQDERDQGPPAKTG